MKNPAPLFLLAAVVLLGGLFWWLKPAPEAAAPAALMPAVASAPASAPVPAAPAVAAFEFRLEKGHRVSGPELIQVVQGTALSLRLTADRAEELHVHGYDLHLHLKPGEPGTLDFVAEHSGRFDIELHGQGGAHGGLVVLEVTPR